MQESEIEEPLWGPGRFPNPTVNDAGISSTDIQSEDGTFEVKNVLWSTSGMYYEFSIVIKKSIYGLVVRANMLEPISADSFRRTGNTVAMKVCAKDVLLRNSGVSLENPITEIGAMQDVGPPHPNLAAQFECCMDEKNIYSVLKFHPGVELFDHILNSGPLNEASARCMFQQLMLAVFRLQQRDIAHRDISLENIMFDASNHATVLIDFGLCVKLAKDPSNNAYLLVPNAACGKGYYMPPESSWNGRMQLVNPQEGDIWSAGMCLLYSLLGFPPIERACDDDVRYNYLTSGRLVELLEHWDVPLSPDLVDLIQMMLRREPSERPSIQAILQHTWMQADGISMPFQSSIDAEEIRAALGYAAQSANNNTNSINNHINNHNPSQLPPLVPPAMSHLQSAAAAAMSIHTDHGDHMDHMDQMDQMDDCTTARDEGEMSFRSSCDSRWSSHTTPTAAVNNNNHSSNINSNSGLSHTRLGGGLPLQIPQDQQAPQCGSYSSTSSTHLPYNDNNHNYNDGTHYHSHSQQGGLEVSGLSGSSSGVSSGAATPNTQVYSHASTSTLSVAPPTHSYDLRNSSSNAKSGTSSPASSASIGMSTSTNPNTKPTSTFTGYHTRSHSFGKAPINYAV